MILPWSPKDRWRRNENISTPFTKRLSLCEVLADALRRLLEDTELRNTLIERGLQRVQNFTWERSAQQLRQVYERVLEMPVRR